MNVTKRMLESQVRLSGRDTASLAGVIEALRDCAHACTTDVDADLDEPNVLDMVNCIRLCLSCGDVCTAVARLISRPTAWNTDVIRPLLEACVAVCKSCGDECERHADMHEHCRVCAEVCRRCEKACSELTSELNLDTEIRSISM